MKAKLTDVASLAGVSLATADRVINNRPGVRQQTRQKVLNAVEELGYAPDPIAASLAKPKIRTVAVVLPTEVLGIYQAVVRNWQRIKKNTRYDRVELQLMPFSPLSKNGVFRCLNQAKKSADGVILCALDSDEIHEYTEQLAKAGIVTHTFMSGLSGGITHRYVGFDNYKLGRTTAYLMMLLTGKKQGTIQTHAHHAKAMSHKLVLSGKNDFFSEQDWPVTLVVQPHDDPKTCGQVIQQRAENGQKTMGIICIGDDCLKDLIAATSDKVVFETRPKIIIKTMNITPAIVDALLADRIDAIFFMDTAEVMENAIEGMIDALDSLKPDESLTMMPEKLHDVKLYVRENLPDWCYKLLEKP